ncbi:Ig-like domain-containing protein [Streptomyces sp. NPDC091266]|uniref:L,D-transpeptidase family protein n=1 Tax=Streptomyces sp. NPDC091266 TaxID=3365978 RepID=UPI0038119524
MSQSSLPRRLRPARSARGALALVPLLGLGALTGCSGVAASADKGDPVKVALGAAGGATTVQAGDRLRVSADGGVLTSVTVADPLGRKLAGGLGKGGTVWTSHAPTAPATKYSVVARTKNPQGVTDEAKESLTTAAADKLNKPVLGPGTQGATVGVAQPLTVTFDFPVTERAAVERRLKVTTDNRTTGAWGWVKDHSGKDRVDWRPKEYWKPGTRVTLRAGLKGVDSGGGRYFAADHHLTFTIGPDRVAKVDLEARQLSFVENGRVTRRIPVSAGTRDGGAAPPTGVFPLMAKEGTVVVRPAGPGAGRAPARTLRDAMRLTDSGTYAHATPRDADANGPATDGFGSLGMTDSDADWLYGKIRVGDPFEVTGSSVRGKADAADGIADWRVDWSRWQEYSALSSGS